MPGQWRDDNLHLVCPRCDACCGATAPPVVCQTTSSVPSRSILLLFSHPLSQHDQHRSRPLRGDRCVWGVGQVVLSRTNRRLRNGALQHGERAGEVCTLLSSRNRSQRQGRRRRPYRQGAVPLVRVPAPEERGRLQDGQWVCVEEARLRAQSRASPRRCSRTVRGPQEITLTPIAPTVETVRAEVVALIKSKIIVGHALFNDLAVLQHRHDYEDVRDTALFYPLRERMGVKTEGMYPSLRGMAKEVLGKDMHDGAHCPIEDARVTMEIFLKVRTEYEKGLADGDDVVSGVPR
ncbi:hypothetical protein VHUM_01861 [Vanrija humicola]|uniref:Exonuclease domain-containing protein n=1 Tax=Vanrija humicola TaxID=5417 RepID=A0A7D8V102_VANHU|nr:hypothetical protein VHUM_01861 [Vanrija humicola]